MSPSTCTAMCSFFWSRSYCLLLQHQQSHSHVLVSGPKTLCNACGVKRCRQMRVASDSKRRASTVQKPAPVVWHTQVRRHGLPSWECLRTLQLSWRYMIHDMPSLSWDLLFQEVLGSVPYTAPVHTTAAELALLCRTCLPMRKAATQRTELPSSSAGCGPSSTRSLLAVQRCARV